tara:strand:+ start:3556 stop:4812 length:1257 start_codon:yes stop_codon:yes gene_type:complete
MAKTNDENGYADNKAAAELLPPDVQNHFDRLNRSLHALWKLGRNVILVWAPYETGIEVLVLPNYAIAALASRGNAKPLERGTTTLDRRAQQEQSFIDTVISGPKQVDRTELQRIAGKLDFEPQNIDLPFSPGVEIDLHLIDSLLRRYSLSYVEDRAVALFDIVNFSLYSPLEQVTELNSLAYSVNSAHSKLLQRKIDINFARSTTGDGFYIWNRDRSIQANVNLYHFMHLVLADNAIARTKAVQQNSVPLLRTCFDIGGHYEFYQSEGLSPTVYSYIVGEVTIELARMIDKVIPGQIMVGDFLVDMPDPDTAGTRELSSIEFIEKTQQSLSNLQGLVLSDDEINSIQCYLTGQRNTDGGFGIKRYLLHDKHGLARHIYNAKVNIYRQQADPIYLGVQDKEMQTFESDHTGETVSPAAE